MSALVLPRLAGIVIKCRRCESLQLASMVLVCGVIAALPLVVDPLLRLQLALTVVRESGHHHVATVAHRTPRRGPSRTKRR